MKAQQDARTRAREELREDALRPDALRAEQAARLAADVERLLRDRKRFVRVACPACGEPVAEPTFAKQGLDYVTCIGCETLYVSPRPTPELLHRFYATSENYEFWNAHVFPASEAARLEHVVRPRVKRVERLCAALPARPLDLLEVGAGFGTFCAEIAGRPRFGRILAVEPTPALAQACRERGVEVVEAPIEDAALDERAFDVIAAFEVIEHLFAPLETVRRCAGLLRPGGLLVLTCPNVKGFDVSVLGPASDTVDAEHLNYFHPASVARLVARAGLEPLEVTTPGALDVELVRKKALAAEVDLDGQPFVRTVAIDRYEELGQPFQRFLAEHGLSSHMWLVARRPA